MREDVAKFAELMSQAMDSKAIERDKRNEPHYLLPEYNIAEAMLRVHDKVDQLSSYLDIPEEDTQPDDKQKVIKTAVHLANFCMIIAAKIEAGQ